MVDIAEQRKEKVFSFLKKNQLILVYGILLVIILLAFSGRMDPMPRLIDSSTGDYIPIEVDSFVFLRYAQDILVNGTQSSVDTLRYYPDGYKNEGEFSLLATVIVYLYKVLHAFNDKVTLGYADALYPALAFAISLVFFFLFVRKVFDYRAALLATVWLAFIPTYVQRTIAGFSDKESLGMLFFFMSLYFFVVSFFNEDRKKAIVFGIISGVCAALMGKVWGGVRFLFLVIGVFILIEIMLNRVKKTETYSYTAWFLTTSIVLMLIFPARYSFDILFSSVITGIIFLAWTAMVIYGILQKYDPLKLHSRFKEKMPVGLVSLVLCLVVGIIVISLYKGFDFFIYIISDQISFLKAPFAESRWAVTLAESHQPYMRDLVNQIGKIFFGLFLAGTIIAFYKLLEPVKENRKKLTMGFAIFVVAFSLNRYAPDSMFNGDNLISLFLFFGSFVLFFAFIMLASLHVYRKRKEHYQELLKLNGKYILLLTMFFVTIVGARTIVRLVVVFSPIVVIFISHAIVSLYDYAMKQKHSVVKIALVVGICCLLLLPNIAGSLVANYKGTTSITQNTGPIYTSQWQEAMAWARNSTATDAVFLHWWDYGYWVQTGGQRATVSDGGNNGGPGINYFTARNLLTSPDDKEALAFMKARGATYALIISEDIGKYPAFSSIGSDLNNDRYSWINVFSLDDRQSQEKKNQTVYVYTGGYMFDEDFVYDNHLFPKLSAGIGGFLVPFNNLGEGQATLGRPSAIAIHNNKQYNIPVNCAVVQGKKLEFADDGLDSCLYILHRVDGSKVNPLGAMLHLSKKVKDSFLARYYLYGEESEYFHLVYSDAQNIPLMVYNGRFVGPHKIWEANIPVNIAVNETLRSKNLPDPRLHFVVQ